TNIGMAVELDLERVVCRLSELEGGARGFTLGSGDWPLRGFVVRVGDTVRGYLNRCPHAGHPLDLRPHRVLTADGAVILCCSQGALLEKAGGSCVGGDCAGQALPSIALQVSSGFVLLDASVDVGALGRATP